MGLPYRARVSERWFLNLPGFHGGAYVIAYVELDEGPRVLTNIVGVDPEAVRVGDRVTAVFEPAGSTKVLRFTPSG